MSEEEFWHSTPKKINTIWKSFCKIIFGSETDDETVVESDGKKYKRVSNPSWL